MTRTPRQRGFTLVELLVVILIMAILIALLVPAIAGAVKAANDARVTAEITTMQTALADFKSRYGEYPPSRIALYNNGQYALTDPTTMSPLGDVSLGDINQRTVRAMKKYFPRAGGYFNTAGAGLPVNWAGPVINPAATGGVILQGHECLVFFLGGMPDQASSSNGFAYSVTGFSKDPVNPFNRVAVTNNRTQPLFEFAASRLQDVFNVTTGGSGAVSAPPNGFPSYIDPLSNASNPRPYAYFSAYGSNGYDPNDDDSGGFGNNTGTLQSPQIGNQEFDDNGSALISRSFYTSFPAAGGKGLTVVNSTPPNPYTSGVPDTTGTALPQKLSWINGQSFQLFSAGRDGQWGLGGAWDGSGTGGRLPVFGNEPASFNSFRTREKDNLTNFSGGKLD